MSLLPLPHPFYVERAQFTWYHEVVIEYANKEGVLNIEEMRNELERAIPSFVFEQTRNLRMYKNRPGYTEKELFDFRDDAHRVDPEALENFWNIFVPNAIAALASEAIQSQTSTKTIEGLYMKKATPQQILSELVALNGLRHDIGHTIASYAMTGKLGAAFYESHAGEATYLSPLQVFEEVYALVWDKGDFNFLQNLLKGGIFSPAESHIELRSKIQAIANRCARNTPAGWRSEGNTEFLNLLDLAYPNQDLEKWYATNRADFLASMHTAFVLRTNSYSKFPHAETQRTEFAAWNEKMRRLRAQYPAYDASIHRIANDTEGIAANLALWNEYRRIAAPLLHQ